MTLPILTFHALDHQPGVISFPPRLFACGMARLHTSGYRSMSLLEAVAWLRQGRPWPDRAFVLTFDDGYRSVYTEAFPVLQHYGMTATVFLVLGRKDAGQQESRLPAFEGRTMLSWHEIHEMQQGGISFGAHTLTHPDLTRLSWKRAEREICEAKALLEGALGTSVACFAYPYGRFDAQSRAIVAQHFTCACSDELGLVHSRSDPYTLERVDAYYLRSEGLFGVMPTKLFSWYVRARNLPRRLRRAVLRGLV
jgi:peptidoglycan/xylan/chitin deacetylase (PgdA/CDA1 family)